MSSHTEETHNITVEAIEEHEDGSATYTLETSQEATERFAELGIKFLLYCAACGITTDQALEYLVDLVESDCNEKLKEG